jgi:two-component SAPR family response regulator
LSAVLEQAGYVVDVAEDGFEALKRMQHRMPDLVITDLRMPNMNGFELLSVIRKRFPELPTIAISGEFGLSMFTRVRLPMRSFKKAITRCQISWGKFPSCSARLMNASVTPVLPFGHLPEMPR